VQATGQPRGEALVGLGVGGEHGHLLSAHQVEDGLRDRRLGEGRPASGTGDAQLCLAFGGEEEDVRAFGRKLLEHRLHDLV